MSIEQPSVLIVAEDTATGRALTERLRGANFSVLVAQNGRPAVEAARAQPDLIVLSSQRAADDKTRSVCEILKRQAETALIPIVYISASPASASDRAHGLESGADAYLADPVDDHELLATIRALLRIRAEHSRSIQSERQARHLAEQADHLKDEFLAMLSHDLRTPLMAILGWTELLKTNGVAGDGQMAEGIEVIARNAKAQAQLVDDLLDVSRIISGKLQLRRKLVALPPIVEAAIESLQIDIRHQHLSVERRVAANLGLVSGDPNRLQQIAWNLISNAIKFSGDGNRILIRIEQVGSQLHLSVADHGTGIDPQFLPFVFDRFRQADTSTGPARSGLGLGLAIVRQLAELHGGSVSAESAGRGLGSIFTLSLPVAEVSGGCVAAAVGDAPQDGRVSSDASTSLDGLTLLVVDDEPDAVDLLRRLLQQRGARVLTARNADEGLRLFESGLPDVLVSDIAMPGEDGLAFIRRVREIETDVDHQTPAIAVTAFARDEDRARVMSAGFSAYIAKPMEPSQLVSLIRGLCRKRAGIQ
jgi:signal transduction histidine kinase